MKTGDMLALLPHYAVVVNSDALHAIRCDTAREEWRIYYRSVRIFRRMRRDDLDRFRRFSSCWWQAVYKFEEFPYPAKHRPPGRLP